MDHGSLFQESDRKPIRSQRIDYEYFASETEDPTSMEMAFVRPLKNVKPRLELLGFTLDYARHEYAAVVKDWSEQQQFALEDEQAVPPDADPPQS